MIMRDMGGPVKANKCFKEAVGIGRDLEVAGDVSKNLEVALIHCEDFDEAEYNK